MNHDYLTAFFAEWQHHRWNYYVKVSVVLSQATIEFCGASLQDTLLDHGKGCTWCIIIIGRPLGIGSWLIL